MSIPRLVLLLILTALILSGERTNGEIVTDPMLCGRVKCHVSTVRKFKYLEKMYYQYQYQVNISTNLGENLWHRNESRLFIDADVILRFSTPCEGSLRFDNVSISHDRMSYQPEFPDRAGAEFKASLEHNTLRFAFDDGIVRELCPTSNDPVWALNLRRGVLSMLQNTMLRFDVDRRQDELDVNGICETHYQLHEARRTSLIVHKSKNLASCRHSSKHLSLIQSQIYRSPLSRAYALRQPLLISNSECQITIDHNIYQRIQCRDHYRLRPLSNGENAGARTEVTSSLELMSELRDNPIPDKDEIEEEVFVHSKRTTLLYDHAKMPRTIYGELRTSRDLLKTMCILGTPQVLRETFSQIFTKFIHSTRMLDYQGLLQLYLRAQGICKTGRKHIIDALPFIGNNAAVNVMKDLIIKKNVTNDKISFWVTAFTLIPRPDKYTLYALAPLLDFQSKIAESQFILSYSSVIHAYCTNYSPGCMNLEPIKKFLKFVEDNVEKGCRPRTYDRSEIKQTLEALKAVGNAGVESDTLVDKLRKCINDESGFLPMEVKVAAIEAHRRLPNCEKSRNQFFLNNYRNFTVDTELRIASYIQIMRCPDYNVLKIIRQTLEKEEINQVGSYVWSHLKNMLSSSSPSRIEIQSLLNDHDLGSKFNSDLRKFSRNYENSFFSEEYNFGANYQTNLIFSPKSYIPRTASFNLTVDLFGESVNFFEVNMRAEGLEFYAENLFGPSGPFSGIKVASHFRQFLRNFRSTREDKKNEYWKSVKSLPNVIDNDFDHPRLTVSYKIFGNEIKFMMLDNDQEIRNALTSFNLWEKVKQVLSGKEIMHYENTAMFLDSSYVVPLTTGLPIRLDISGSAACNIKLSGILNSLKLMSDGELEINGSIMPSVNVDVTGAMTVDAFYKSTGIKLKSSMYSIGAVEADLKIESLKLARLSWKIPNHKMDIFSLSTDVFLVTANGAEYQEQPTSALLASSKGSYQENVNIIKNTTCSWSALDRLIGLKLCADYQFPNVTKDENASYFLLNGPTKFKLSLIKADPTAGSYLLEYKWTRTENESTIRLAFDTPGTQVQREISATVSFDALNNNVTLLLKSKGNSLIAQGAYKRTDNETFIDIGLDSNGIKHLDASVGFSRKKIKHGYTFAPKLFLAINNERIINLSGIIRNQDKNNASQCDIDLRFETKNLSSHVFGYILKSNISVSGNIKIDYRFHERSKDEVLQTEFSVINRSTKTITYKAADMKLHSTAYPQLNIMAGLRYQHALGNIELKIEINTSPHLHNADRHKLTAQFVATYSKAYFQTDGANISAHVAITKPAQDIDVKIGADYHSIGAESKTSFLIRYAPSKEIMLNVNVIMPRGTLFIIESRANITIPNFNSMLVSANIIERTRNLYDLDFAGTWFSGHNISVRGIYYDRSTISIISHNLKILLKSPSFNRDILLNCKLHHEATNIRIDLFVEQVDMDKYALTFNHTIISPRYFRTFLVGRYRNCTYSLLSNVDMQGEATLELHLDKWRDVHVTITNINEETNREYGIEIKWDRNRDPTLTFLTNLQLNRFMSQNDGKNISTVMRISYPGRLVTGSCLFALRARNNYVMDACLEWSIEKSIRLTVDTDYDVQQSIKIIKLESQLLTPFEHWKKTSLNGKYLQTESNLTASGSIYWQDSQHVIFDLSGSYNTQNDITEWKANCGLINTVNTIQYITANLTHAHTYIKVADSHILIKYHPDKVMEARSIWLIENGEDDTFNVTGNLQLVSPVLNYRKGALKCHLSSRSNWKFYGAANLDLDKRKYTSHLIGDIAKLKESMVQFNITTPFEKYGFIRGRFGLSDTNKHIVAEVATPAGPLGIEGICQLFTNKNEFSIKLLLATPIDALQQTFFIAKLNHREADFRVAYNNMTAGFQGVWFYNNITNFHYSYILYTPLQGFHEVGAVTKLVVTQKEPRGLLDIDTEFSLRVVELVAGIKVHAGPKSSPPIAIPIRAELKVSRKESVQNIPDDSEDSENNLYWKAEMELNSVIVETITGSLDFDREGYVDKVFGLLNIPSGTIVIEDQFYLEDFFNIKNDLSIDTPFNFASEIFSTYSFTADMENFNYLMDLSLNVKNSSEWIESGFNANYTHQGIEDGDPQLHFLKFDIKTPLNFLKFMNSKTVLEIDENYYRVNISLRSVDSLMNLFGFLEQDSNYLDIIVETKIDSPILEIPQIKISAKKDYVDKEQHLEFRLDIEEPELKSGLLRASWLSEDKQLIRGSVALNTWLEPLIDVELSWLVNGSVDLNNSIFVNAHFKHHRNQYYKLVSQFKDGKIEGDLIIPIQPKRLFFNGNLTEINDNLYQIVGELTNIETSEVLYIVSPIKIENGRLSSIDIIITPVNITDSENQRSMQFKFKTERYSLTFEGGNEKINGNINMNFINYFNWDLRAKLYLDATKLFTLITFMNVQINGNTSLYIETHTPDEHLKRFVFYGNLLLNSETGNIHVKHQFNQDSGHILFNWRLFYFSDMFAHVAADYKRNGINIKDINTIVFYVNPKKAFKNIVAGFDINADQNKWRFGVNASVGIRNQNNIDMVLKIKLPPPDGDVHNLLLSYHGNNDYRDLFYIIGYSAELSKLNYASDGSIHMNTNDINGYLRLAWGLRQDQTINNLFNITFSSKEVDFIYSLFTPKFLHGKTVLLFIRYDANDEDYILINTDLHYPEQKRIVSARISYQSFVNINSSLNVSTPLPNFSDIGCEFIVLTTSTQNKRFIQLYWQNNSALLDSDYTYRSERVNSNLDGHVRVEFPLNTRHTGLFTYGYKKRPLIMTGYSELIYNDHKIIEGCYSAKSESRAGFEKDRIEITIENSYRPVGIIYINQYQYSASNDGSNYPSLEHKEVNIYQLNNITAFNISGTSNIRTTCTGQEIQLTAVHFNRTVKFRADYDVLNGEFKHSSWLSLAEEAWISYNINTVNKTTDKVENQFIVFSLLYPERNFTLDSSYLITNSELNSEAKLLWESDFETVKTLGISFDWVNETSEQNIPQQTAVLSFKHPSFQKDVKFIGKLARRDVRDLLNVRVSVEYSVQSSKLLILSAILRDESDLPIEKKYSYYINGEHPRTQLNLDVRGHFKKYKTILIETVNRAQYKRSFLPEETGKLLGRIDLSDNEVEISRVSNEYVKYLQAKYCPNYPDYIVNGSIINGRELNATGTFIMNIQKKLMSMMINYTPDAIESLRMYGNIPDARNAEFNIWRTYDEDLIVSDVSFYVRLNHSRLLTSKLQWRPELKTDIVNIIRAALTNSYEELSKDIDYWRHYIRSETISIISDIWIDAQDELEEFLEDLNDLKMIEGDFENLKIYLNDSYNANDFYIKNIVTMAVYVIDELSLRSHIQSLPNIINEIWEIMGESGEAIRNSLLWIIETIKNAYHKLSEITSAILKGDSMNQIAKIVEKFIIKYDMLVKDLHVSFIKYIEYLYSQIYQSISLQWYRFLMHIEPIFIRLAHYLETVGWKAIQEFFNFLYDRKIELITSPYYDHFSNFTQDIDKFYRDIKSNDIITNIQKYSAAIIQFIKERYFAFVPFGKELKDVVDEIINELKELKKLPSVKYALEKIQLVYGRVIYFWEYFQIKGKLESTFRLIHSRLMDISQTALQSESRYREAKTRFIYDPYHGLMCLEQKLPMSWHAFNQTPEFQEIPEYRAIADMGSYFVASNTTFWTLYYQIKPLTEPSNWLPPFKAQAMIVGAQHYRTFDGRHFEFAGCCTYLVARDFVHNHFAILIKYECNSNNDERTHQLIVLIGDSAIQIDVFKDNVKLLNHNINLQLPVELDNDTVFLYQEDSIVTIERKNMQFKLECNLKYDLCILELGGWYYGKTAGLLGTMNNEQIDDMLASDGTVERIVGQFAYSWSLERDIECTNTGNFAAVHNSTNDNVKPESNTSEFCHELFTNKSSEFSPCFSIIDPVFYRAMCINSINDHEACSIAMSYLQTCMFHDTYLRIPNKCTACGMNEGKEFEVPEGDFRKLEEGAIPRSADVIFIVEAKECNRDIRQNRNIEQLITYINQELNDSHLINNRWSLVIFGGDGVYDKPRSLILENQIFQKNAAQFADYFDHIPVGDGNQDIFQAIRFAAQLVFRAGVSKTFVLMPCTHCETDKQTLDYSVLYHALQERGITLHILMNAEFQFEKGRLNKIFYGLDATRSYTKKDARILSGDIELRRQVKLSKNAMGYCMPLSLETNGTIFSGSKLRALEKPGAVKKFASVFAKRLVLTAQPDPCQLCECIANNDGLTKMECAPCEYPMPVAVDFVSETFNEDVLSSLQSIEVDYDQVGDED